MRRHSRRLRTAWETPDIGGVWDFRMLTPLQRPDNRADQALLSEEEVAEIEATTVQRAAEADLPMMRGGRLFEYACHEGNYGLLNILRGAREDELATDTH